MTSSILIDVKYKLALVGGAGVTGVDMVVTSTFKKMQRARKTK